MLGARREYDVTCIGTFADALDVIERRPFDLYVFENDIDDLSGLDLCGRIRSVDPGKTLIIYSSNYRETDRETLISAGVTELLSKPDGFDRLISMIRNLLVPSPPKFRRPRTAGRSASII